MAARRLFGGEIDPKPLQLSDLLWSDPDQKGQ